jgi:hypothetical protein
MFGHSYTLDLLKYLDFQVAVFISPGRAEGNITFVSEFNPGLDPTKPPRLRLKAHQSALKLGMLGQDWRKVRQQRRLEKIRDSSGRAPQYRSDRGDNSRFEWLN